jgi:hypothetical protein
MDLDHKGYYPNWQNNRVNYIINKFGKDFFKGKKLLELGSFNGYIGNEFSTIGCDVTSVDGRKDNVDYIKRTYPHLNAVQFDLDTDEWPFGEWDIIIDFGLLYHLKTFHKEHLVNCISNSQTLFLESVIFDCNDSTIFFVDEGPYLDQSLAGVGGTPSTKFVEDILLEMNCKYELIKDKSLDGETHHYAWEENNCNVLDRCARRMWCIQK